MAQFDLDRIFNNAENQSQKKKKKYDIDRILNSAEDISTRNTTMGTIPAITGSAIQATNKIIAPMAKTTTNLTEADLRKIEQNSGLKTGTLNLNKMQAQQQKFENLQQKGNEILQDKNNKIYDVDYIYSDLGIDNGKVFKKSSAFKDGYDFGDITKTVLDTGATLGTEVTKGVANIGENIGDLASYGIAGVADLLGEDEYADKVRKNAQVSLVDKYTKPLSSKIDKNSILGSKGKEMAQSLGYVAGTAAIGTATGGTAGILGKTAEGAAKAANIATTATTFASSMGSGITEAYQNGATDQEALAYGIISGIGEAGSELMFGGLGKVFGKVGFNPTGGALDEVVVQGLSKNIKNKMVKTLVQSGLMATGEGIEEVVSGVVSAIGKKATFMKEEDLKNILKDENLAEQFWMGTLTSVIAQAPSTISSIKNKTDYLTGEKWETTQKNKTPELPQNVQNNIEQQTVQTDTKTAQNQNMSQINNANNNNLKNTAINEVNSGQTTQNQKIPQLNNILNNKELPMQSYIYEKSDNPNVDILRKSASKYLNNSEQAHKFVQILEKISQDKNVEIRFDADLKTPEGKIANGSYSNGVITINPNSTRAGEFIAIHELTHAIGTKQMENIIEKYSKSNIEFNEETKKLLQNYSNTEMNEEALADISGQLFGTQEFINNISQNNPNVFQRIYSEIKYLWHQFKGYKTQEQFIDDLYYKWTQAYNGNNKLNNTENYHVSENFSSEIDKALNNKLQANTQVKARDYTPQILVDNGVDNLPMLITQRHIKSTIYTLQEAENLGLPTKNVNYHGLGKDLLIKAIDNLDSPQAIYKTSENNYLVVTEFKDNNGKEIVIPIQINGNGRYNNVFIDENQIKSVYGRNNLNNYINKNNFEQIYKKNEELDFNEGIQYSNVANSSIKDSITPQNENVNTTTKYSMQESENNSGSFKFDNKGRELSKEQQEYFKNSKVRDENGNLQEVYHGSNTDGITIFDIDKTNEDNVFGKGFYFTDNELMAESYAEEAVDYNGGTKQIYKGYLNIKNPFVVEGENTVDLANKIRNIDYNADIIDSNYGVASTEKMKEWLISKGYDGIEVKLKKGDGSYYVAFNSNQIKKVDNISPTSNSDIRYSQNNKTWQDYLEKNYKTAGTRTNLEDIKINNNIAPIGKNVKRGPLIEEIAPKATTQVKNSFDKNEDFKVPKVLKDIPKDKSPLKVLKDEFIQATVNKGHYVDQLAKQKNNPELTYKYDRNLGAFAEGQFTIGRGQTDNNGKIIGKSVKEIWKPAEKANLVNEFSEYLLYKHNVDRINQNNPLLGYEINAPQSAEIAKKLETKYPQFKEWAKDVYTYYDNELQNFVDAGLITEEFKNQLNEMYPHYVKISRNIENNFNVKSDEKVAGGKNPIKRATGGNSDILPLKETMASYAIQAKKAIRQNELGKEVANTLKLKDVIKKNNKSVYEEIARTNDSNAAADMFFNSINNSLVDNSDGQTKLIYYDDGDIVNVKIDDKLYKSLDTKDVFKDFENSNILTKAVSKSLQKVSKIQRDLLTTYNLGFAMVNPIKDIQDGAFNSKYPGKFAQNYAKAIGEMTKGKKSELYMLYLANGGNSNTYYEYDTKMPTKNYKFGDGINKANEVVETLPRFAEFISTIENGGSINEAMYNAAEITTNFKRGGNFTKFLNRNGANFLNASVQGLSKQIRNITGQNGWKGYAQLITKSVLLGVAPALLNDVLLGDDDEYEELPDYIKDEYYLFKKSDGNFVRIPKGRVLSVIGMTARRTVEATKGNEEAFDNWWSEVVSQMAPNNPLEDNITAPIKAVKDNKTWYGTNIVSSRLQKELPKNQYDETTDEFSKWLGEKINVSPKKINYLIDQYSGGIGDIVLPKITPQAKDNIIQDKFTANSTLKNKNPGKFYELLEETTQLANDVEPVESDVLKAKYLNSVNSDMSKLYKEKRTIQMSDMTQEAKKEAVEEIQSKINSLAEQAINESNNVTTNSNYATVRR